MIFDPKKRGYLRQKSEVYGTSVLGAPLRYFPCRDCCRLLVLASIHGEEPETTFLLSRAFRAFDENFSHLAVILCANPDGVALGTRGNANGVDLNRNFPTSNWSPLPVLSRSVLESSRDTELSPGSSPGAEPETAALIRLIQKLKPESVLSMHAPMGCVDAPGQTPLVQSLQMAFNLPWVPDIGYSTPGSFGTWCAERKLECVTLELPRMAPELLFDRFGESLAHLLQELDR